MDDTLLDQLISTILCMLQSPNREVIKAALGFVKVVIVCVEQELLTDQLETIVCVQSRLTLFLDCVHFEAFKSAYIPL